MIYCASERTEAVQMVRYQDADEQKRVIAARKSGTQWKTYFWLMAWAGCSSWVIPTRAARTINRLLRQHPIDCPLAANCSNWAHYL